MYSHIWWASVCHGCSLGTVRLHLRYTRHIWTVPMPFSVWQHENTPTASWSSIRGGADSATDGKCSFFTTITKCRKWGFSSTQLHYPDYTVSHLLITLLLATWHLLAGVLCWRLCRCCTYAELFYPASISPPWLSSTATFTSTAVALQPSGRSMRRTAVSFCHVLIFLMHINVIHSLPLTVTRA